MWFTITKINDESTTLGFGLGDQTSFRLTPNEFGNNEAKHSREEKREKKGGQIYFKYPSTKCTPSALFFKKMKHNIY